ncbi:MAG: AMP-binding protein [Candidatus Methanofastidiosia archaeon]
MDNSWMWKSRQEILEEQEKKLLKILNYAQKNCLYYRKAWKGITINKISDFKKLPFCDHRMLQGRKSRNFLAVPPEKVQQIYCSGGTSGNPKVFYFSQKDWHNTRVYRARCGVSRGIRSEDIVGIVLPYGIWSAGQSSQAAHELLNALVIPAGIFWKGMLNTFDILQKLSATVMITTPSIALIMAKKLESEGYDVENNNLRLIGTTGEDLLPGLRKEIEERWGAEVSAMYAATEAVIGVECKYHDGYHVWADDLLIEVVDNQGAPVKEGQKGTLVITKLFGEAIPLIRYKLGDIISFSWEKCKCGMEYPRIWFEGRGENNFVLASGVNVEAYQLKDVISHLDFPVLRYKVEITEGQFGEDIVTFFLETGQKSERNRTQAKEDFSSLSIDFDDAVKGGFVKFDVKLVNLGSFGSTEYTQKQEGIVVDKRRFHR